MTELTVPNVGDLVQLRQDGAICEVIGSIPGLRPHPVFALRHPTQGDVLGRRTGFNFPVGAEIPLPAPKVFCSKCRWLRQMPHPTLMVEGDEDVADEVLMVPACKSPTFAERAGTNYITGEKLLGDCYQLNGTGECSFFEAHPEDQFHGNEFAA